MTALGGPLIILAIVAASYGFADVLRGIDTWMRGDS